MEDPKSQTIELLQSYIEMNSEDYSLQLKSLLDGLGSSSEFQTDEQSSLNSLDTKMLEETFDKNICKTFVMPIFNEVTSIHKLPGWKVQQKVQILSRPEFDKLKEQRNNPLGLSSYLTGSSTQIVQVNQVPEPSEYARRINEHFISFI